MSAHNDKLRAAREATPSRWFPGRAMTRSELAHLVVEHVWRHEAVEAPFDRKHIAKLETGRIRYPTARYRRALRAVLGVDDDADLGFRSPNRARGAAVAIDAVSGPDVAADLPGDWHPVLQDHLDATERHARALRRADRLLTAAERHDGHGPTPGAPAQGERARLAAGAEATGRLLLAALAQLGHAAGSLAVEAGDAAAGATYLIAGVRAAHTAGNEPFAGHLFSLLARTPGEARDDSGSPGSPVRSDRTAPQRHADQVDDTVHWAVHTVGRARLALVSTRRVLPEPVELLPIPDEDLPEAGPLVLAGAGVT